MPDAEKEDTINALIGACFGASGQRCMALTTIVFVGDVRYFLLIYNFIYNFIDN